MKKLISTILVILLLMSICYEVKVYADEDTYTELYSSMSGVSKAPETGGTKTKSVINQVIGILQFAGTGISLVVISLLGIKYILASPSDKADVKRSIMPIIIGCALLFAAVNIVGIIEKVASDANLVGG